MRAFENSLKIALIGIYALVIWKGIELARFALVKERAEDAMLLSSRQTKEQILTDANELGPVLKSWQNVAGVRSDAVSASIAIKRALAPNNFRDLESEAISILAVRPMSAQAWTLLAGTRLLSGQPTEKSASALETGLMLAPNEDDLIAERLVYGLLIWEYLSPSAKERIAADLAIVGGRGAGAELQRIRTIIAGKELAARNDIRDRLERGPDRKVLVDRFGF